MLFQVYRKSPAGIQHILRRLSDSRPFSRLTSWLIFRAAQTDVIFRELDSRKPVRLVIHVGAHLAEESRIYESIGAQTVVWIEADPVMFDRMERKLRKKPKSDTVHLAYSALVSEVSGEQMVLRRYSNDGASSSIYSATSVSTQAWPGVKETGDEVAVESRTLSCVLSEIAVDPDSYDSTLLVVDVQGHELGVLKGAGERLLSRFQLILVEVSMEEVYCGGTEGVELLHFLASLGFHPISPVPTFHGDVLLERRES